MPPTFTAENERRDEEERLIKVDQVREGVEIKLSHRRAKEAMEQQEADNVALAKENQISTRFFTRF